MNKNLFKQVAYATTSTAASTTLAMLASGEAFAAAPWAPINAVNHMVDGEEKQQPLSFSPRESLLGLLLNASAMAGWASIYEIVLAISNKPSNFPLAAGTATLAYLIDYHVVPKRLVPGIEKHMSRNGLIVCYIALALGLWLSPRTSELEERNI